MKNDKLRSTIFNWKYVDVKGPDECWPWKSTLNRDGYGVCQHEGKSRNASRAAFITNFGEIASDLVVRHKCDNAACCNPSHLIAGTQAENLRDCRERGRQVYLFGADHLRPCAKLTAEIVLAARYYYKHGMKQAQIGRLFGVDNSSMSRALRGITWAHVA